MHFCSPFLNLIFWASLLLAAGAIPYDRSKRGVYQSDPDLAFGQHVTSGFVTLPEGNVGVIIMKKVEGISFLESSKWSNTLDEAQKLNALNALKREVQEMIYNLLRERKPLFSDFQNGNILIDAEEKAHLVDFGFPGVWPVKMVPERNVFNKWFERRWYFLWESSYAQLEYPMPVFYQPKAEGPISKKKNWSKSILTKLGLGREKQKGKRGSFAIDR
ncbi:hypothetical protein GG344DRAFT_66880 [Lentinula edodes]|nr:hypothetical protein GG344DRAFT_66880 [Lentinula edodes]